ncbi:MAG: hypothetical protein ACHQAZ_10210 [Gammaproteobacteria bacterium]
MISNTASLSYTAPGGSTATQQTNTVKTTVVTAERTPSTVAFLDYAPSSPVASGMLAGPTQCSVDGGTTFNPLPNPVDSGSTLSVGRKLALAPTSLYTQGETLFIELTDLDQNLDPAVRDTVLVTVSMPSSRESVVLQLTETGVNTGVFVGYVPTTSAAICFRTSRPIGTRHR